MSHAAGETSPGRAAAGGAPAWPRAALLSLSDKRGAAEFAAVLAKAGTRIIASGGTAEHLRKAGLTVTAVEDWTGSPELLGGRVKTLHPHVHAPILARRGSADDLSELRTRSLEPIDLVAVTLYPFEEKGRSLDDAGMVEEIDIGGVALLRAAAKNHDGVIVLHDPSQYEEVSEALARGVTAAERRRWATAAFARTARYDGAIAAELARRAAATDEPPPVEVRVLERARTLRYGENPHQAAALYVYDRSASGLAGGAGPGLAGGGGAAVSVLRETKELSYNNLLDLEAAVTLAGRFQHPACVIVKHNQPCGVACGPTLIEAYERAFATDPMSAFGGIVAVNRTLDRMTAEAMAKPFAECIAFPDLGPGAELAFIDRKNLRLVRLTAADLATGERWSCRFAGPWALLQREDATPAPPWRTVTRRSPTANEWVALQFAWEVVAAARSNAIAIARGEGLIGLGSGQTSRVDAVDVAIMKAKRAGHTLAGAALASDGFFPFPDGLQHAVDAGVRAIVQPGGSVKDGDVIAAADKAGVAMVFTDRRVFRH
ncbi:MAG TPA: bifunctional phosphoribosylaminoimidazolecarboxamide formyltransferase/IMP cyclohydrolase [Methylomirabilota bacterium]|nr:bifunctional phosphoribosylaminoimidazolecarboxamide formyltransferase/IMP cyclohydrolase [Methylomirabilota bacterium]